MLFICRCASFLVRLGLGMFRCVSNHIVLSCVFLIISFEVLILFE